jgi:hypothetical protein
MNTITKLALAVACAIPLIACGGGGDDGNGGNSDNGGGSPGNGNGGSGSGSQTTYTVTPSVSGSGGTISPATPVSVQSGATAAFTLTPTSGYAVASVTGTCGGTLSGNTYTTKAISADCTVVAAFAASNNGPLTFNYEDLPWPGSAANALLTQINGEGGKGYRFLWSGLFTSQIPTNPGATGTILMDSILVKDGTTPSYAYEQLTYPSGDVSALVNQANTEGAKGYLYEGNSLYRKDGGSSATYTYAADPAPTNLTDWLTQANGRGRSGYWFYGWVGSSCLYIKNNASNATYIYDALLQPSTATDLLTQLNSEGTKGYRALSLPFSISQWSGGDFYMNQVYIKDQTQSTTFTYQSGTATVFSALSFSIDPLNSYGAQGYGYLGNVAIPENAQPVSATTSGANNPAPVPPGPDGWLVWPFYFKASNCSGFLCTVLNPPTHES